ncbi:MAG TPA: sodium:calcium antiporter [Clostridia bacterium]|nr:sodium:calcium antiporter [Clostridia bacterium]
MDLLIFVASLLVILSGAFLFTNAVEWLGKKLNLTEGAVGSILAAVGTAMPETVIPVISVVFGVQGIGHEIGTGAILGAPFMLGTLAFFVVGLSAFLFRGHREKEYTFLDTDTEVLNRDLTFFIIVYTVAIWAAFLPAGWKFVVPLFLIGAYIVFVYKTLTEGKKSGQDHPPDPLFFARKNPDPTLSQILSQLIIAFLAILIGAKIFVDEITGLAFAWGIAPFIFSLLIAPVATELPEKLNSVIWIRQKKDTFALSNITGAMVFQSSLIPALGIFITPWELTPIALLSAFLAILSALIVLIFIRVRGYLDSRLLLVMGGIFYTFFVGIIVTGVL